MSDKNELVSTVEALTDNALAFIVVGSGVWQSLNMQMIDEWHIAAIGMIMAFYFVKLGTKL